MLWTDSRLDYHECERWCNALHLPMDQRSNGCYDCESSSRPILCNGNRRQRLYGHLLRHDLPTTECLNTHYGSNRQHLFWRGRWQHRQHGYRRYGSLHLSMEHRCHKPRLTELTCGHLCGHDYRCKRLFVNEYHECCPASAEYNCFGDPRECQLLWRRQWLY